MSEVPLYPPVSTVDAFSQRRQREREFCIDNLLVRIHIEMFRWTGLAPWEFEFPFPDSLKPIFLSRRHVWNTFGEYTPVSGADGAIMEKLIPDKLVLQTARNI